MSETLRRIACAVALSGSLLCMAAPAYAQSEDERAAARLFRAGSAAFDAGDFSAAANAFEEANRRVPRGAAIYNAALAWEAAKDFPRAADGYEIAIADTTLAQSAAEDARTRLASLERRLGFVHVVETVGATVTVGHVVEAKTPRRIHLPAGEHTVLLKYVGGRTARRVVTVAPRNTVTVRFPPGEAPASGPVVPTTAVIPTTTDTSQPRRLAGWVGIGSAVALSGVAIVLGVSALRARDDYDSSGRTDTDARSAAVTLRTWANVSWVGAGALGLAGAVLVLTAPRSSSARATIHITPASVGWSTQF